MLWVAQKSDGHLATYGAAAYRQERFRSRALAVALGEIGDESAVIALAEVLSQPGHLRKSERLKRMNSFSGQRHNSLGQIRSRAGSILIEALANDFLAATFRREQHVLWD